MDDIKLIFEKSVPGRKAYSLPACDVPGDAGTIPPEYLRGEEPELPEVGEIDAVRHFTWLSKRNHSVDSGFYPLGSCTMKYNPKVNEDMAALEGFSDVHPYQSQATVQGCLKVLHDMDVLLSEITGMKRFSLQPAAGAHGELTGLMIIKAWHEHNGDKNRRRIIVPDSAHGTNPASAAAAGFEVVEIKSDENGLVDLEALRAAADGGAAGLMLTNPNTLGLFERDILAVADIIHNAGGLLYYDGANANAILGKCRPGDMGFDVIHLNLHKTFATPHGGGGPGSGPVGVREDLVPFLPRPRIEYDGESYRLDCRCPLSIGRIKSFYGNFGVIVRAYAYILSLGAAGLREVSEAAVLNANYLLARLRDDFAVPYAGSRCMHEFVLSGIRQKEAGSSTLDMAKRLLDFGYHPPTVYFPLIVKEAMMIEPTETENRETLDDFARCLINISEEALKDPGRLKEAPANTPVSRLDETRAARQPVLRWTKQS